MADRAEDFLTTVLRSGLLSRDQLDDALRDAPKGRDDAHGLAEHLIRQGKLSRFQAHKLLKGAFLGLQLGAFQIQTPIGRGGMGTVYLALDTRSKEHVAIKVLPPRLASEKGHYLARFRREMEMSTKVTHPNIAHTNEVGEHKGVYYIAMEYIPGASLHRLVTKEGPIAVSRVSRIFAEVAAALEHAHQMNLIHRDLKPSNIMITPNGHAKVLDLGLAVFEGENSQPLEVIGGRGYMVGSVDYMAPEQMENSLAVDARTDLYAVGCSIYFALTGQPPFPGGTRKEKFQAHRFLDAKSLIDYKRGIPEKFVDLVERLMAKNPERRPASARALRQELLPWCREEADLPLDSREDAKYQEAVRALENAAGGSLEEEPIIPVDAMKRPHVPEFSRREWWWIVGGLGGFWLVLAIFLVLLRIFR